MKLLLIFCTGSRVEAVRRLVDEHEVHGYTEIPEVLGSGLAGRRLGTRAYPGTSAVILTAVEGPKAEELIGALEAFAAGCGAEEGIRALVLPVERMI